jgi:hypothetical protein
MSPLVRRTWPILAVVAGGLLIYFECRDGVTGEGAFWLLVGGLIVVLALADLITKGKPPAPSAETRPEDRLPLE